MFDWISQLPVILVSLIVALSLPLLILAYYTLRLGLRRRVLAAKIIELHLEPEYLKVYHFGEWEAVREQDADKKRAKFEEVFSQQFRGDNSFGNFVLPLLLTTASTFLMALVIYQSLVSASSITAFFQNSVLPLSVAGSLLYVFPLFTSRYASLSLNPHTLFELLGKMWLSAILGVVLSSALLSQFQPIAAFLGSLLPVAAIDLLRKTVFSENSDRLGAEDAARESELLQVLHQDRDLLSQLNYIGIRSVLQLAYENPLKIFVESDLDLVACIDLVDQANLHLYVPDNGARDDLNKFGIRTAIDIMTQLSENFPTADGKTEYRELRPNEPLPAGLEKTLGEIATAMKLDCADALVNFIHMMEDNPQLRYILGFWDALNDQVDRSTVPAE